MITLHLIRHSMSRLTALLFLSGVCVLATGCSGPEVASKSDRPWNSPRSWEHGLPTGMNEGR